MARDYSLAEQERDQYITWLSNRVNVYLSTGYVKLIECLWDIPYVWQLDDDRNRAIDGNMLRTIYLQSHKVTCPDVVFPFEDGCTVLEFLIALAGRANDLMYVPNMDQTGDFFWQFMSNLGLDHCTDDAFGYSWDSFYVSECVSRILTRTYGSDGLGGIFPLRNPVNDQRTVPIWYQMNAFLNENC